MNPDDYGDDPFGILKTFRSYKPLLKPGPKRRRVESDDEFVPEEVDSDYEPDLNRPGPSKAKTKPKKTASKDGLRPTHSAKKGSNAGSPKKNVAKKEKLPFSESNKKLTAKATVKVKNEIDNADTAVNIDWDIAEYMAETENINKRVASNIVRLFREDNTIPFIARYRRELTDGMDAEKLRDIKDSLEMLESVKQKAVTVAKSIKSLGKLNSVLENSICYARSISELDHIYAPFKPGSKGSKAERARQLGLEQLAVTLMDGTDDVHLVNHIQTEKEGLRTADEVLAGIQHIIADIISKDRLVLEKLRKLKDEAHIMLQSSKAKATKQTATKTEVKLEDRAKLDLERKFQNYFEFTCGVRTIKPHQVLAINRGENLKVLSVKVLIPDRVMTAMYEYCRQRWLQKGMQCKLRSDVMELSIKDAYTRLIHPLLVRQVRATLNQTATHAAVEVFALNLKNLLLSPPVRGSTILGIDPGFRNGCKIGVVSQTGQVLHTDVVYPKFGIEVKPHVDPTACRLKDILSRFDCQLIALGNGTACRETETYLSYLIQSGWFAPMDVTYTIVSEQGASIYSCSPLARKEFPDMDPNVVSAVSLARRIQDPLGELVKVEPQHLGVGMYQHDVPQKRLSGTLDEVVVECVSFVGVDVNTASETILKRVAGLSASRAAAVVAWRTANGHFVSRRQLMQVKGIGAKAFEQCAGFVRVIPETTAGVGRKPGNGDGGDVKGKGKGKRPAKKAKLNDVGNPLDRTWIHPESYNVAERFVGKCEALLEDLGTPEFIGLVASTVQRIGLPALARELGVNEPLMKLISDGLQQPPGHDLRSQSKQPLFRRGLTSMADLKPGTVLTGRVVNVTHFGVFTDIGVGQDGLIHNSSLRNTSLQIGDRVEVRVDSIELQRKRIGLGLLQVLR